MKVFHTHVFTLTTVLAHRIQQPLYRTRGRPRTNTRASRRREHHFRNPISITPPLPLPLPPPRISDKMAWIPRPRSIATQFSRELCVREYETLCWVNIPVSTFRTNSIDGLCLYLLLSSRGIWMYWCVVGKRSRGGGGGGGDGV